MMKIGVERRSVQNPIIKYACDPDLNCVNPQGIQVLLRLGWEYVLATDSENYRGGKTGLIFKDLFKKQITRLNKSFMTDELADELIKRLERIPANIEGNLIAWEYLKGLKTVFVPDEKRERNVVFIDTENINNNVFQITDEFKYNNGTKENRADIVFLINGVPVLIIETKAATKQGGMSDAIEQLKRYHRQTPEMMALMQVYAITYILRFLYGGTWSVSNKALLNWKDEMEGDFETLVKTFLDKTRIVKVISEFILFTRQNDELKKVILRPHQMRAVDKTIERARDGHKKRGLIWHTQGSGKTFTMITVARRILEIPEFENPMVLMLVDRNELQAQLFGNLSSVGFEKIEIALSKKHLKKLLAEDRRGLIVSMIHKFEGMDAEINSSENIYVLIDEAHRTTGGTLGNYLVGALPNATFIGFTGTPIDRTTKGKGTFITFGSQDPPKGYLDKYSIAEAIEDKATVPLHYTLAPNELRVDKDVLQKEFLDLVEAEGISDIDSLNKVLDKAVNLKNMLKNRDRIKRIAKDVAEHYKEVVEPLGYKAFLVAVDREACALYKEELDKLLPEDYSKVVISSGHNDEELLERHHIADDEEKKIRKDFLSPDKMPKILIVTEKLLTGFDAPILYCMYLDKPMRDHVLLQAIARVNRPYEDENGREKPSGFVLDYVGIFENLEKALAFDSADITGVIEDIKLLKEHFKGLADEARIKYLPLTTGKSDDKAVEEIIKFFMDEEKRVEFYGFFKEISQVYDIISPDAFLSPYIELYETLFRIFQIVKEAFNPNDIIDKELSRKIIELVQKHTVGGEIQPALEVYEIDDDTLKKIEESKATDTEKVFNLLKSINKVVAEKAGTNPYLISIGEKAQAVAERFKERQADTQLTLDELKKIIEEANKTIKEQTGATEIEVSAITTIKILRDNGIKNPEKEKAEIERIFENYPHWRKSENQEKLVKIGLIKVIRNAGIPDNRLIDTADQIIRVLKGAHK